MPHSFTPILIALALSGWAVFRQTLVSEVKEGPGRFRLAVMYCGIGVVLLFTEGWQSPRAAGWLFLAGSVLLSLVVGLARGRLTRVWVADDGCHLRQGTILTVALFVLMIVIKVIAGLIASSLGVETGADAGQILLVVAVMVAVQAEVVLRRSNALTDHGVRTT